MKLLRTTPAGDREVCVAGTPIGAESRPWLTSVDGFNLEIELADHMALMKYDDVPGMIGRIGTAFGNARINIANMAVSRRDDKAMMALSFDSQPDPALIGALDGASGFDWARSVGG